MGLPALVPRIALATFDRARAGLPESVGRLAKGEDEAVLAELATRGVQAASVPWQDPAVDWSGFDLVVPKSTWGYDAAPRAFLDWVREVAAATRFENPAPVVLWNAHKSYLLDLAKKGVAVPETVMVRREEAIDLGALMDDHGWKEVVVKRVVGAGARGQGRFTRKDVVRAQAHLDGLLRAGDAFVQPFLPRIATHGERSIVVFGGEVSHAVARLPRAGDYLSHPDHGATVLPHRPTAPEAKLVREALRAAGAPVRYARVDVVDLDDGTPAIMELELIEPYLFLASAPGAVGRYADALVAALKG